MTPDFLNLLADIFEVCIIPLLGVLTAYAVKYIQVKSAEITEKTDMQVILEVEIRDLEEETKSDEVDYEKSLQNHPCITLKISKTIATKSFQ